MAIATPYADSVERDIWVKAGETPSVLDFIPIALHKSIRELTCPEDLTSYFMEALSFYKRVFVPAGGYGISQLQLNLEGQMLLGEGRQLTRLFKYSNVPMLSIQASFAGTRGISYFGNYDTFNDGSNWRPAGAPSFTDTTDGIVIGTPGFEGLSSVVNVAGNTVTWVSGTQFTYVAPGLQITINGTVYVVLSITSATVLRTTVTVGALTAVTATIPAVFNWILGDSNVYHHGRDNINWQDGPSPSLDKIFTSYGARWGLWTNQINYLVSAVWTTGTVYHAGDFLSNAGHTYVATTSGVAGGSAPVHLSGSVSDGGVTWAFQIAASDTSHATIGKIESIRCGRGKYWEGGAFRLRGNSHIGTNFKAFDVWGNGFDLSGHSCRPKLFVERSGRGDPDIPTWTTATVYAAGAMVVNAARNILYVTLAGGTSGATNPTHTSGSVSDGGVAWIYRDGAGIACSAEFYQANDLDVLFLNAEDGYRLAGAGNRIKGFTSSAPPSNFGHNTVDASNLVRSRSMASSQIGAGTTTFETFLDRMATWNIQGIVNTAVASNTVTWVSGGQFTGFPASAGHMIVINSITYTIASISSVTVLHLTTSPGNQTGVSFSIGNSDVEELGTGGPSSVYDKYLGTSGGNMVRYRNRNGYFADVAIGHPVVPVAASYTLFGKLASDGDIYLIDASGGAITFNLWNGGGNSIEGRVLTLVKTDATANAISVAAQGTIVGSGGGASVSSITGQYSVRTYVLSDAAAGNWIEVGDIGVYDRRLYALLPATSFPAGLVEDNTFGTGAFLSAFTTAGGNALGFIGWGADFLSGGLRRAWFGQHQPLGVHEAFVGTPDSTQFAIYVNASRYLLIDTTGVTSFIGGDGTALQFSTATGECFLTSPTGGLEIDLATGLGINSSPASGYDFTVGDSMRLKAGNFTLDPLTGSRPVVTDSGKNLSSAKINLSSANFVEGTGLSTDEVLVWDGSKVVGISVLSSALILTVNTVNSLALQYKDHAGANQTQTVVTSITTDSHIIDHGLLTT